MVLMLAGLALNCFAAECGNGAITLALISRRESSVTLRSVGQLNYEGSNPLREFPKCAVIGVSFF
jgi:hypothetical protein